MKRWYDWVFDCFWLFFLCCFYAEGWSGKFNFLWFIEGVMGEGSMGEKREERFVFSFVFFLYFAFKRVAFALLRNSIRFCANFCAFFFFNFKKGVKLKF